jgi:hypothetical protein
MTLATAPSSHLLSEAVTVVDPPLVGAGPCPTQAKAKHEAARLNARHGGPGFFIEERTGDVIYRPHAYFAERASPGEWYVVLKEMPAGRVVGL